MHLEAWSGLVGDFHQPQGRGPVSTSRRINVSQERRRIRRGEADGRLIISPSLAACCLERVILNLNSVG